jgi:hypothetical protein
MALTDSLGTARRGQPPADPHRGRRTVAESAVGLSGAQPVKSPLADQVAFAPPRPSQPP